MTDFIDGLEQDLIAAARRRASPDGAVVALRRRRRPPTRTLALAAALITVGAGSAAGGTLLALRGSVIPTPSDTPPEQIAEPGTARVAPFRIPDPDRGALPWTVRVARSAAGGLVCSTVGQVDAKGRFGLVGNDKAFRTLDPAVSDSCGAPRENAASLIGARIFDAPDHDDVRTVVSGVAGGGALRAADLRVGSAKARRLPIADGAFAAVLRGYPEDHGLRVTLTFADGHHETHDFGRGAAVVAAPGGAGAWRLSLLTIATGVSPSSRRPDPLAGAQCASFAGVRPDPSGGQSPQVCGRLEHTGTGDRGYFLAARRVVGGRPARRYDPYGGHWGTHAPVTAVWGRVGDDVAQVTVQVPGSPPAPVRLTTSGGLLAVFAAKVDPRQIVTRMRMTDGRTVTVRGDAHLLDTTNKP